MMEALKIVYLALCAITAASAMGLVIGDAFNLWRVAPMAAVIPRKAIRLGLVLIGGGSLIILWFSINGRWTYVGFTEFVTQLGMAVLGSAMWWSSWRRGLALDPEPERSQTVRKPAEGGWSPLPVTDPPPRHQRH